MRSTRAAVAAGLVALVAAATAAADDDGGEDEVTARTACLGGRMELILREEEEEDDDAAGEIEIRLRVDTRRPVYVWRIVLVHERRLLYQGTRRWSRPRSSVRLARDVPDWPGRQTVAARVSTGDGRTCRLEASV